MTRKRTTFATAAVALALTVPALAETPSAAYVAAINSNDLETFLDAVTDDVVFIAPGAPVMEGKSEVGPWVGAYFAAVHTAWQKKSVELVVAGDWAFERYVYRVIDTPRAGGAAEVGTGHGINIYRREGDGVWRVARDIWSSGPVDAEMDSFRGASSCAEMSGPC